MLTIKNVQPEFYTKTGIVLYQNQFQNMFVKHISTISEN